MAYTDDAVLARLSALNDTHDSIATAAQWIMFHRRHADRTVQIWLQRLKDSPASKRLSLMYLANEVAQQSRIRHKEDFIIAFSPVMAEATSVAYKGAPSEVQARLRRVVDVWKDRVIFEKPVQEAIDTRLNDLDKARGSAKSGFGGSPFGGASVPSEVAPIVTAHQQVAKLSAPLKATISSADQEYQKQADPSVPIPSAPVFAARLNGLLKTLANAENAVAECVKAREGLITGLETLLEANRAALEQDKAASSTLSGRRVEIEEKKQQVELAIMQALGSTENHGTSSEGDLVNSANEPDRPEMEALTPPSVNEPDRPEMEALTPPSMEEIPSQDPLADQQTGEKQGVTTSIDQLASVASTYQSLPISSNGANKRRRVDDNADFPDLGGDDGIDADVAEMLKGNTASYGS